ncbi:unnamed protein product [Trichogramma brassicae]|uniref:Reverse transcriptase domain-containing protein n=1 Tax=Trichogramma brassicae TaxID=86971 RepID=A0A6H5IYT6_9HYME|nr:unnamed protein product [Trichogramma brassicae]
MVEYALAAPLPLCSVGRYRDRRCVAAPEFALELQSALTSTQEMSDLDEMVDALQTGMVATLDAFAPLRARSSRTTGTPWFTLALRDRCKFRDGLYRAYRRTFCPALLQRYRLLRRDIKCDIRRARESYLIGGQSRCETDSQRWSYLRRIGLSGPQPPSPFGFFTAAELLDHYCTVTTVHPCCSPEQFARITELIVDDTLPSFEFRPVQEAEVLLSLTQVAGRASACFGDGLSLSYFCDTLSLLAPTLTTIFNLAISTGKYPSQWKRSIIRPLSKVRAPQSPSQTRPIANLAHLAKVFDKLLTAQLTAHLETYSMLSPRQSGFRRNFSTQTALFRITEDIRRGVEDGLITILLLFDFRSAFDTLDHATLLRALKLLNFSSAALALLHSYLSNRSQAVMDDSGGLTAFGEYTSCVPQGSTPAPILFAAYTDTLTHALRHCTSTHMLFADDLQIYLQCPPAELDETIMRLNEDARFVSDWAHTNGLSLNVAKTRATLFASNQYLIRIDLNHIGTISLDGTVVPFEDRVVNLGLVMTPSLSWDAHVRGISSRIHGVLHRLRAGAGFLPVNVKKMLVNAFIIPHFDYACLAFIDISASLDIKLRRLLNACIRYIFQLPRDAALRPYYDRLDWLLPSQRRNYFLNVQTFKALNGLCPDYISSLYHWTGSEVRRSARIHSKIWIFYKSSQRMECTSCPITIIRIPGVGTRLDLPTVLLSAIVDHSNAPPSIGPYQDLRFVSDSDSDDERYLCFRVERLTSERLPFQRFRSVVVIPPGSGLIRRDHEELACKRHPTRPELCVPPARTPRAESPGLRQPIAPRPRGRSLSPYLRENPPILPHLHRSIKIRLNSSVTARVRPRVHTPPRSPDVPAKRHFGLAFLPSIGKSPSPPSLLPSAISRLGPPVTPHPSLEALTPPASPNSSATRLHKPDSPPQTVDPPTFTTRRRERNSKRALARR